MRHTPLSPEHQKCQAKWAEFAGWQMPLHYGSQLKEHEAVRTRAGIFDVSHMQVIDITGTDAFKFLSYLLANDIAKTEPGKALYSCMLNPNGGVVDDLICYYLAEQSFRLVVNAGCAQKDIEWIQGQSYTFEVEVKLRPELCILAVQGPQALALLKPLLAFEQQNILSKLNVFEVDRVGEWMFARTGYTGEDGVEIVLPAKEAICLWQKAVEAGIQPVGLGARDTLRLEAGLNLYGQDMDEEQTPWTANLGWTVALENPERTFIGKEHLVLQKKQGVPTQLLGVMMRHRGVLRPGQEVIVDGVGKGVITSGSFSPTLNTAIGFARVPAGDLSQVQLWVHIRDKQYPLQIVKGPFVRQGKASKRVCQLLASQV